MEQIARHLLRISRKTGRTFALIALFAPLPSFANETFFIQTVLPKLAENGCVVCHARDHLKPNVFVYRELLPYLAMGTSSANNVLLTKMADLRPLTESLASHPGGQRCSSVDDEPCKTLQKWWQKEFGAAYQAEARGADQ